MNKPHQIARLTVYSREQIVADGPTAVEVAASFGVSVRTVRKWVARYRQGGRAALANRASAPARTRHDRQWQRLPLAPVPQALRWMGIRHIYTRPYTPKTNGKAERFIQTLLREWAYGLTHPASKARNADLPRWLDRFNRSRPHSAINGLPPLSVMTT